MALELVLTSNLKQEVKKLTLLLRFIREGVIGGLSRVGQLVAARAKEHYLSGPRPEVLGVITGRLRSSIMFRVNERAQSVVVGTNVVYAPPHEIGDLKRGLKARPFLGPAVSDVAPEVADIIAARVQQAGARAGIQIGVAGG